MALEQVTPVVPQGTFSETTRKVPVVSLPRQWSWGEVGGCPAAGGWVAPSRTAGPQEDRGAPGTVYLQQRVPAVPAKAVAPPIKGDIVAIPVHGAGGQAGLLCALPLPVLAGAGGRGQQSGPSRAWAMGVEQVPATPWSVLEAGVPPPTAGSPPTAYQVLQPTRMVWPGR